MKTLMYFIHAVACGAFLSTGNYYAAVWCALATWYMYLYHMQTANFTTVNNALRGLIEIIEKARREV